MSMQGYGSTPGRNASSNGGAFKRPPGLRQTVLKPSSPTGIIERMMPAPKARTQMKVKK